jgi:hypothetical protein
MIIIFDKDISETTVVQYLKILLYSQAERYKYNSFPLYSNFHGLL